MTKFKVGDKVKLKSRSKFYPQAPGCMGLVVSIVEESDDWDYTVVWENNDFVFYYNDEDLMLYDQIHSDTSGETKLITAPVPEEYNWMAMDKTGSWFGYEEKPVLDLDRGIWDNKGENDYLELTTTESLAQILDWEETLHKI